MNTRHQLMQAGALYLQTARKNAGKKKTLWAVAANVLVGGSWRPDLMHVHATDNVHALAQYYLTQPGKRVQIIGVAPVVGYFIDELTGAISA